MSSDTTESTSATAAWLRERVPATPPALLDAMLAALPADAHGTVADTLAAAALRLYAQLRGGASDRGDALPLLAADALLTHALQAQAEADPGGLAAFCERWGAGGALAELAPDA
ncbi:hypothetical protein [Longimicrobium sp.]|uniref:hypothetical protein n=1 Tax=Longimicrobium sp. TaxID=2029185 RepID=UPI002BA7B998|nr:hypothetical protein [Longimicrobium sp.]HSU18007.1 hypothetical protein [Longimicrobium sp.]